MVETNNSAFIEIWNPTSAILASLQVGIKPIGLEYCDQATSRQPVHAKDHQIFQLFFLHATLRLNRLAGII